MKVVKPITIELGVMDTLMVFHALKTVDFENEVDMEVRDRLIEKLNHAVDVYAEERKDVPGYEGING